MTPAAIPSTRPASSEADLEAAAAYLADAEREVREIPETRAARPRPIASAGVVGGGTMGAGIAIALLDAGLPVTMLERDAAALARGFDNVQRVYLAQVEKARITQAQMDERLARLIGSTTYDVLASADLVIEAVFEDLAVKQAVFAELDRACKPGAVLATNTSYLDIDAATALRFGLINEIVAREQLLEMALRHAHAMLKCSPLALETSKRVVLDGMRLAGANADSQWMHPAIARLWASHDAREGVAAFVEKRTPVWRRRPS